MNMREDHLFKAKKTVRTKALKWKHAWNVSGIARMLVRINLLGAGVVGQW